MTQYDETVDRQRQLLAAEEWSTLVRSIHVHSSSSMWYDDHPEHTAGGKNVTDREFNSGIVERYQKGVLIHVFGDKLEGEQLLNAFAQQS